MMDEEKRPPEEGEALTFLARAQKGLEITTRDDQQESASLLDAAKAARNKGGRLRLIDTGKFSVFELEWLAEAGADLYTSDEARPNLLELSLLARACARGRSTIAYFHHGEVAKEAGEGPASRAFLAAAGREGIDVHLSNREHPRDPAGLVEIAYACGKGGSRLVYYHHGPLERGLEDLALSGGWIHIVDTDISPVAAGPVLEDIASSAANSGSGLIIHLEKGLPVDILRDLLARGAFVIFKTPPAGRRSPLGALERQARKKTPDRRSYYLYSDFLP